MRNKVIFLGGGIYSTASKATVSEVLAGTDDAKFTTALGVNTAIDQKVATRAVRPRRISDGATTNRAEIAQYGADGALAGSPATFEIFIPKVPESNPSVTILAAGFSATTAPVIISANDLYAPRITNSGALTVQQVGVTTGDLRTLTYASFRANYSGQAVRMAISFPEGNSTTNPTITINGVDKTASFTLMTEGTPPNWMDAGLVDTYKLYAYNWPAGDIPEVRIYNAAWSSTEAATWTAGGARPDWAERAGSMVATHVQDSSVSTGDFTPNSLLTWSKTAAVAKDGKTNTLQCTATNTSSLQIRTSGALALSASEYKGIQRMKLTLMMWVETGAVPAGSYVGDGFINSSSAFVPRTPVLFDQWFPVTLVFRETQANVRFSFFESVASPYVVNMANTYSIWFAEGAISPLGTLDIPITQPGLTTGDALGRFSRRLLGITSHPLTDRGTLFLNTNTSGNEQAGGGALFDSTDYALDGPMEQITKTGTPTTSIGHTSGGTQYKASGALSAGINPLSAVTRKLDGTSVYVASNDTTKVRTTIPFRKISTPSS